MLVIVICIYIQKSFFLRNVFIFTKSKKKESCLRTDFFLSPNTESSLEQQKWNFALLKQVNDSIAYVRRRGGRPCPYRRSGIWGHQAKTKTPPVRREGGRTRAVVQGTGEGGGIEGQIMTNQDIKNFQVQDHRGGSVFYLDTHRSSPSFQVLPAAQSEERFPRRLGARSGKVGGGQLDISWSPSEAGGQWRFTVNDGGRKPRNRAELEGRRTKGRAGARGKGRWGRVQTIR